jgi:dTDP-4-dehydrorhamnose reductase
MKILVTGSNGLIGQKIINHFLHLGNVGIIAASGNPSRYNIKNQNVKYETFDLLDKTRIKEIFTLYKPDVIINSAAVTQVDECEINESYCRSVNVGAVEYMAGLAREFGAFFLQLSTDFVFNGHNGPYNENAIPDPVSKYGISKLEAEKIIIRSRIKYAIVRTILVYGFTAMAPRQNLVTWVIESLKAGKKIRVVSDQFRTPTLAEDVATGCSLIIQKKHEGLFHIGGIDTLSPYQMAVETARCFELDENLVENVLTIDFPQPGKRPMRTGLIIDKARKLLGYEPCRFEKGLSILKKQYEDFHRQ